MAFEAVNFADGTTLQLPVSFIANTIRTQEDGLNRISYYLTDAYSPGGSSGTA